MPSDTSNQPVFSPKGLLAFLFSIAVLYFARGILIPFVLALLFAFLLTPAVARLESWRLPRIPAVLVVLVLSCSALVTLGWFMSRELLFIVEELPAYKANIDRKLKQVQSRGNHFSQIVNTFQQLGERMDSRPEGSPQEKAPTPVRIVQPGNSFDSFRGLLGPILFPLEQSSLVLIFTLFILIDRDELRNRLLKLTGQQQIHATTQAMDDAATRVGKYVAMQSIINAGFGLAVGIMLFIAGVPSPLLWGVLAAFLRFVPYLGPLIAGSIPFVVALATTDGWTTPAIVMAIFFFTEVLTGNAVEPWLLGAQTGLSSIAILLSAVFWALVWGPVGLILSTPLTVCLSVLGRHAPQLRFLDVILGDEPALALDILFYQRLLALDQAGAFSVLEGELKTRNVVEIYDEIVIPALVMSKADRQTGALLEAKQDFLIENIGESVAELAELSTDRLQTLGTSSRTGRVFAVPSADLVDETIAAMFAQIAEKCGLPAMALPVMDSPLLLLEGLSPSPEDLICISAAPPLALRKARRLAAEIHSAFPEVPLLIGLWNNPRSTSKNWDRVTRSFAGTVLTKLSETEPALLGSTASDSDGTPPTDGTPLAEATQLGKESAAWKSQPIRDSPER